jgi:hypothetical protein
VHVNQLETQESLLLGDNFVSDTVKILRSVTPRGSRKVEIHSVVGNVKEFLGARRLATGFHRYLVIDAR